MTEDTSNGENGDRIIDGQQSNIVPPETSPNYLNNNKVVPPESVITPGSSDAAQDSGPQTLGWGKCRPKFLQRFCTAKWALFWLCWCGALQGLMVNGFVNVVITTIEKRFGLRSSETGLIASGYDIASFLCLVPVSYFGGRLGVSKPRFIAWGVIIMGVGSLIFALPHFLVGPYRAGTEEINVCADTINDAMWEGHKGNATIADSLKWCVWWFFVAQLLQGIGASPLFTLGVTYIDENVSKKMSSVYLGIYYTMAIIGPALGYILGGQLLLIYTDFLIVDAQKIGLTNKNSVWIGAWWIGFIFSAFACFLVAIPMLGYPKILPGAEKLQENKITETYNAKLENAQKPFSKVHELPKALAALMKNPTFFFLNLAGGSEGLILAGFAAFLPKQIENQFAISPILSALLVGVMTVPAGGGGTFLGGYLIKKFNLKCAGIIKMCFITTIVATLFTSCFLLSCPNVDFAGLTTDYRTAETNQLNPFYGPQHNKEFLNYSMNNICNFDCGCSTDNYDPICGIDNIVYYNPCYAGCREETSISDLKTYQNCSCIQFNSVSNVVHESMDIEATNSMCSSNCQLLPYFMLLAFSLMFFTFLSTMPALAATLRCVREDQRSFALGIQWIKVRVLGTIPAPMIFGALIDQTCIFWQRTEDGMGACLVYNNENMNKYLWILALVGKLCTAIFFFIAWWFYIPPKHTNLDTNEKSTEDSQYCN